MNKIGFGGGCHWCTEAVFQHVDGVQKVEQGWIASSDEDDYFSEAIIAYFDPTIVTLKNLIHVHLQTHSATSNHIFRKKYRSAVYTFSSNQYEKALDILEDYRRNFNKEIITRAMPFRAFKSNVEKYQNYFIKNSENQFCQRYIVPKLNEYRKLQTGQSDISM